MNPGQIVLAVLGLWLIATWLMLRFFRFRK